MRTMSRTARMGEGLAGVGWLLNTGSPLGKQGKFRTKCCGNADFAVLDSTLARIVNGADCFPAIAHIEAVAQGAIAQLGERVVRNDEVGGSIPPGSTSLRRLRLLRLGKPFHSEGCRGVARRAKTGLGKLPAVKRRDLTPAPPTFP